MGLGLGRRSDIPGHRGRRPGRARVVGRYPEPNFAGSGTTQTDRSCCSILFEVDARPLLINCVPDTDRQTDRQMHSETNPADRPPAISDSSCIFMSSVAGRLELLNVEWKRGNDFHVPGSVYLPVQKRRFSIRPIIHC